MLLLHLIKTLLKAGFQHRGIVLVSAYMALLMVSSALIASVEPAGTPLTHLDNALWWSIVTSTTVGYGDLYPASHAGKIIAVILPMFMGIGLGAAFITHVASYLIERRDQKMHGEKPYTGTGHILLVGYTEETEYLAQQIQEDETYSSQDIVLLAELPRHPMPEQENVYFVKGRPDTIFELNRTNIAHADQIIIHTGNDEASLFALINALKLKSDTCGITVRCLSSQSLETFSSVPGKFEIIMQMTAEMMVQAMQDKVHLPLQILLKNDEGQEIYYVSVSDITAGQSWWNLHLYLKEKYEYLSFALCRPDGSVMVNPGAEEPVSSGCGIWLMAQKRPVNIQWP